MTTPPSGPPAYSAGSEPRRDGSQLVAVDASRMGPRWKWWRHLWLRREGLREVCWFCHADYAGMPCPACGWAPLRQAVFVAQDGKRYTNEVMASNGDPWLNASITMPGMGRRVALPLVTASRTDRQPHPDVLSPSAPQASAPTDLATSTPDRAVDVAGTTGPTS